MAAVRIFKKHESMLPSTEQFIADAIITSHVKLVYHRNPYFGIGQKPKPKMANTVTANWVKPQFKGRNLVTNIHGVFFPS